MQACSYIENFKSGNTVRDKSGKVISGIKVAGKTLQCFQAGQEIIHEVGPQNAEETNTRMKGKRLDGSTFEVLFSEDAEMACTIITRNFPE